MTQENEGKIKHLTLRITEAEHRKIKIFAAEEGITVKELVLGCVDRLIDERKQAQQQEGKE
jgi:predicted HicB family RNase H-like nuclease